MSRIASLAAALMLAAAGCSGDRLIVASDLDNKPFAFVDDDGMPAGRDVEMMRWIGNELNREIEWQRMPFEELLAAAENGEVDCVCATIGITPERAERVLFTESYFDTRIAALVRSGAGEPQSLPDLDGKRVAAGAGTTSERAVKATIPTANLDAGKKEGVTAADRLLAREIDAAVMDGPNADALARASGGKLRVLPIPLAVERYGIVLRKDDAALKARLDESLEKMRHLGVLTQLNAKWLAAASGTAAGAPRIAP